MPDLQIATQIEPIVPVEAVLVSSWGCWLTASRRGGWVAISRPSVFCSELGPQVQAVKLGVQKPEDSSARRTQ